MDRILIDNDVSGGSESDADIEMKNATDSDTDDGSIFDPLDASINVIPRQNFCAECQNLFDNFARTIDSEHRFFRFPHHNSVSELDLSAKNGCGLCSQFLQTDNVVQNLHDEDLSQNIQLTLPMSGFRGYVNVNTFRTRDIRDQTTQYYSELQWNLEKDNSSHDSPDLHPGLLPSFSVRMLPAVAPGMFPPRPLGLRVDAPQRLPVLPSQELHTPETDYPWQNTGWRGAAELIDCATVSAHQLSLLDSLISILTVHESV